jgi:tetratricopeptide (TPR) repeat protein
MEINIKKELQRHLSNASYLEDEGLKYGYLLSLFRYVLQVSSYSAYEAVVEFVDYSDHITEQAKRLLQPSDGDFVTTLNMCIPALREVWPSVASGWFDKGKNSNESGEEICLKIISKRNDRLAHGVFDKKTLKEGLETLPLQIEYLIEILNDLFPVISENKDQVAGQLISPIKNIKVEVIRRHQGHLVLIRKIENKGSVWRVRGQLLDHNNSASVIVEISEASNLLQELNSHPRGLTAREVPVGNELWRVSTILPMRQTQNFEGRRDQIDGLLEWWSDEDSRACLIHGEGGIGKTTLVLEFLNEILDTPPNIVPWRPDLIFYYSAKVTRWGVTGLEKIGTFNANINEALRNLSKLLETRLEKDWYIEDTRSLISKTANLFAGAGLNRDSILIVIDNTETLARNAAEEAQLGKSLREVSTKIGKLIITSRRRESFEATQVLVPPMDEDTGAVLLQKLAATYSAKAIEQSGLARRKKISRDFGGKPILLDVLARYIANTQCSIEDGVSAILNQERGDLGAFLFEDAWQRMESSYRDVFLAIGQLGGFVSEQLVNWSCAEFSCYGQNWLTAFEETRFGSMVDYGSNYDISLDSGAREFLASKFEACTTEERHKISSAVGRIRKKHMQAISAAEEKISDRVLSAFRTNAAKAAKLAGARRDVPEAIKWYNEATVIDSSNPALFDRFAWYLMVNDRLDKALPIARKACALDPNDADSQFTYGMIAARLADVADADVALNRAQSLGKPSHLVSLQKARARLEKAILLDVSLSSDRRSLCHEAIKLLESSIPTNKWNREKHELEKEKLLSRCRGLLEAIRPVRTTLR